VKRIWGTKRREIMMEITLENEMYRYKSKFLSFSVTFSPSCMLAYEKPLRSICIGRRGTRSDGSEERTANLADNGARSQTTAFPHTAWCCKGT
jgi:hypothetical protein